MEITRSEDCLIFNGLTPEITKMDKVYDAIVEFMKKKVKKKSKKKFFLYYIFFFCFFIRITERIVIIPSIKP